MKSQITNHKLQINIKFPIPNWSLVIGVLFVIGIWTLGFAVPAYSLSLNIDPSHVHLTLKPEETKEGSITVLNTGSSIVKIKAYTEDWIYAPDGSKNFLKAGSTVYSCSTWIKLDTERFELGAGEAKKINFKMTAPKNTSGGHVSVIFFETVLGTMEGIAVSGRIGAIVYQDTEGDIRRELEIKGFSVGSSNEGDPLNIKVSLANKGNSHASAKVKLTVLKDDKPVIEKDLRNINLLPQDITTSQTILPNSLIEGSYKAQIDITYEDKTLQSKIDFPIKKISAK